MGEPQRKYKGRGTFAYVPEPWEEQFLRRFSTEGGISLSAKEAGTTWQHVYQRRDASPEFAEKFETARQEMIENFERLMLRMARGEAKVGGFMPIIARLKGELPGKYNDKLQVNSVIGHLHANVGEDEIAKLLQAMLGAARPATKAAIQGEVIEMDPK